MSASTCARGGLASCSNRGLGPQARTDRLDELPCFRNPLRLHFATHSGLKCLQHTSNSRTPHSATQKQRPPHASTRSKAAKQKPKGTQAALDEERPPMSFWEKLVAAFEIFFPPTQVQEAPRQHAKQRLRMILVADRCSVSPTSVSQIKKAIVESLSNFVEIEQEDKVDLNITTDPNLGTIYSVSVPVRRVKPEFDIQTEYENKEFYFDSDGEQIRSLDLSFEDLPQDVKENAKLSNVSASRVVDAGQRRRGPVLPDAPFVDGKGPTDGPT